VARAIPLTVDLVSLILGVRQAFAGRGTGFDSVALSQAGTLELEPVCTVNDAIQNRISDCMVADHLVSSNSTNFRCLSGLELGPTTDL
jgi:hypothetical protein